MDYSTPETDPYWVHDKSMKLGVMFIPIVSVLLFFHIGVAYRTVDELLMRLDFMGISNIVFEYTYGHIESMKKYDVWSERREVFFKWSMTFALLYPVFLLSISWKRLIFKIKNSEEIFTKEGIILFSLSVLAVTFMAQGGSSATSHEILIKFSYLGDIISTFLVCTFSYLFVYFIIITIGKIYWRIHTLE